MNKSLMLEQLRTAKKIKTKSLFAEVLGISTQNLNGWYKRNAYNTDILLRAFPDLNPQWLLTGEGEMFLPKPTLTPSVSQTITTNNGTAINAGGNIVVQGESDAEVIEAEAVELPIVPTAVVRQPDVRLSKWIDKYSDEVERLRLSEIIRSASMVREVKDRDMAPVLKMGQYIYLELMPKNMPIKNGRIYFVDHKKVEGFFRRLYDRGDSIECRADKPAIEPNIYPKEDIYDIYKVVGVFSTDIIDDEETLAKDQQIASLTEQLERLMTQQEVHAQNTAEALASTNKVIEQQGQLIDLLKNK